MLKICPDYARVAWTHDTENRHVLLTRIGCGMWSCDYCSKLLKRKWLRKLREKLPEISDTWYLLTFTAPQCSYTVADSLKRLRHGIETFFKRARRIWKGIEYVRVYEAHKTRTTIHAHLIVCGITPYVSVGASRNGRQVHNPLLLRRGRKGTWSIRTYVKKTAQACGMGYIADVRRVDVVRATRYVCKYLTKSLQQLTIKGLRHVQTTRKIGGIQGEKQAGWQVGYRINKNQIYGDEVVFDAQRRAIVPNAYWHEGDVYPPLNEKKVVDNATTL